MSSERPLLRRSLPRALPAFIPRNRFPWRRRLFEVSSLMVRSDRSHRLGFRASRLGMPHGTKISLATDAEAPGVGPPEMT